MDQIPPVPGKLHRSLDHVGYLFAEIFGVLFFGTDPLEQLPHRQRGQTADDPGQIARHEAIEGVLPNQTGNVAGRQHGEKRDEQPFPECHGFPPNSCWGPK
jgi:hypothetical protein